MRTKTFILLALIAFSGCDRDDAQTAKENINKAADKTGDVLDKAAESTGKVVGEAVDLASRTKVNVEVTTRPATQSAH